MIVRCRPQSIVRGRGWTGALLVCGALACAVAFPDPSSAGASRAAGNEACLNPAAGLHAPLGSLAGSRVVRGSNGYCHVTPKGDMKEVPKAMKRKLHARTAAVPPAGSITVNL